MGAANDPALLEILRAGALLGEGILWDARRGRLWWTDIHGRQLHRYDWAAHRLERLEVPDRVGSFGLVAGREKLIVAFAPGVGYFDPVSGAVEWLARPTEDLAGLRFNDGRVDRAGRFWCGTMVESLPRTPRASLYSMDRRAGLRRQIGDVRISNGLCTSPDGRVLYFADTPVRTIWAFDLDPPTGELRDRRIFARTPDGAYPDGATVDADGCLWSAQWGAGRVVRYTPSGTIDRWFTTPASQPSCACFAGPSLDVLCVTSARSELSDAALAAEAHAGDVFLFKSGVQGLPEPEYQP